MITGTPRVLKYGAVAALSLASVFASSAVAFAGPVAHTAAKVDLVVTDLGVFEVREGRFHLTECFAPYTPAWIQERTDADIIANNCRIVNIDIQPREKTL